MNLICDIFFQTGCGYQYLESHNQNDEISNHLNLAGTICEPIFKACRNC